MNMDKTINVTENDKKVDSVWTKKRKSLDDRIGTIGLLILGVISTPFVGGFLFPIFFICGITGMFRLIGKKRKELSDKQKVFGWILAVIFILGTFFFKYLNWVSTGTYTYGN
jgi:hypothetical protein